MVFFDFISSLLRAATSSRTMSSSAVSTFDPTDFSHDKTTGSAPEDYLLDRDFNSTLQYVGRAKGHYIYLNDGRKIFDGSGGAAVACLGHWNISVLIAIIWQMLQISYCHSMFFKTRTTDSLAETLIASTGGRLERVFLICSGSEATEAAMKLGRQYFVEIGQSQRTQFITREHSYHGSTLGALSLSGHVSRRAIYIPLLSTYVHRVSACHPYRQRLDGETDAAFVQRKAAELDQKFKDLGGDTVIGFICEPISGASLGCATYVPGYLAAMKAVCTKYSALFILDEIMCGMGRSGTIHAWQSEHSDSQPGHDCVPDIQTIGKGLGGGYMPVAAVLIGHKIVNGLKSGSGAFIHGQTYQAFPLSSAAALAVQRYIAHHSLLANVRTKGDLLATLLHAKLDDHPYVGDVRGKGLFWGIEFVRDKQTKEPWDKELNIAKRIHMMGLSEKWTMSFYPCQGSFDGVSGDHVIIAPAYTISEKEVRLIVDTMEGVIKDVFDGLERELKIDLDERQNRERISLV